jgi:hypothetical protein
MNGTEILLLVLIAVTIIMGLGIMLMVEKWGKEILAEQIRIRWRLEDIKSNTNKNK